MHTQMIDSTHVKAHRSASGGQGGEANQAIGRSRGGRNTKIHAISDAKGRLVNILLTGGEAHDCPVGTELIEATKPAETLLGDKAYDSGELRALLSDRGSCPVAWCRIGYIIALSGKVGRFCQAATAGSLTMGSSLNPAMVSSVM
jgi:transposase